MATLA
jgi:hypothetical protein